MIHFFNKLLIWALLILSCALFYAAATLSFPSSFVNIAILITAFFTLVQGCGLIDKEHHFGKYANEDSDTDKDGETPKAMDNDQDAQTPTEL